MPDNERLELEKVRRALNVEEIEKPVIKYKVKRNWWAWALGIFFNAIAIRFLFSPVYILSYVIFFVDIVIVFPEVSHMYYVIENRSLVVKRLIYHDIVVPCNTIVIIEKPTLMTFPGYRLNISEYSLGAYKISYMVGKKQVAVIIAPQKREEFMEELIPHLNKDVVLPNQVKSSSKRQKK